jgi:hypothetical protein
MTKLSLVLLGLGLAPGALLFACATDNGDAVHGEQFGPPPGRVDGSVEGGPVPGDDSGPAPPDGSTDASTDADAAVLPTCTSGMVAVLAGGDTTLTGAAQIAGGAWSGGVIVGGAAKSPPSVVAFGTGFVGLTRGSADALQYVTYGASWGAATAVTGATTLGTPALTVLGTKVQAAFLEGAAPYTNKFFRTEYAGVSWTAPDPVTPPGGAQSFGPSAGTVAAAGTDLAFAQDGDTGGLYVQTWNGTWTIGAGITGAGTLNTAAPALVAVDGKFDLVLLYADNTANHVISYATRDKIGKAWSTAVIPATFTNALAMTGEQFSVASISATTLVVTFRGTNQRPYYMTGTLGASAITWSVPAALLADASTVDSAPAVARGVCGDDAIAVFASAGQVKATHYRGGTWSAPEPVSGASGARVAVSTR